jgi:hypothetical protein
MHVSEIDLHIQGKLAELDQERHMHAKVAAKRVEDMKLLHEEQLKAETERAKRVSLETDKLQEEARCIECQVCSGQAYVGTYCLGGEGKRLGGGRS